jgi:hypothetical protein
MNKSFILRFIFLCTLLVSFSSFGQGYRGKRFTFAYQPGYSMLEPPYDFKHIMMHHKANVGFALSKHFSVHLTGSYTNSREFQDFSYESLQVKDLTGGISFLYFFKNHQSFAPIGRYFGIGLDFGRQNLLRTVYGEPEYEGGPLEENLYYDDVESTSLMIYSAYFGKNFLIKERLLLGYGVQFGWSSGEGPKSRHFLKPQFNLGFIF